MHATVSIIIPTKNAASSLAKCLESLKSQTYGHLEVIVVDGGSTDSTDSIARNFECKFFAANLARTAARRLGVEISTGSFLLFLDSDQTAENSLVSECVRLCDSAGIDAIKIPERVRGSGVWTSCLSFDSNLVQLDECLTYPRFYRRSRYLKIGGHATNLENYMEDRDLYLRLRKSGGKWAWSESCIFNEVGRLNPIEWGRRRAKAADDAELFYVRNPESVLTIVKTRFRLIISSGHSLRGPMLTTVALPVFYVVGYGPRLASVILRRRR